MQATLSRSNKATVRLAEQDAVTKVVMVPSSSKLKADKPTKQKPSSKDMDRQLTSHGQSILKSTSHIESSDEKK